MRCDASSLLDIFTMVRFPSSVIRHQNLYYEKSLLEGFHAFGMLPFLQPFVPESSMFMFWWITCDGR
jgi:hypothetical protein